MFINTLIFIILSFAIVLSTLGYGMAFCNQIFQNKKFLNLPFIGIFGIFFLYIISSITHLIIAHNYIHNSILLLSGLAFFYIYSKKNLIEKKEFRTIIFFFVVLFLGYLISKTNEDFSYYHLPNSLQFSSHKLEFGLGNLSHGFKHFSSIFLINSIFYLPYVEAYLFNITNFMLQIFFFSGLFILISKLNLNNFSKVLSSIILITFLVKFYRLSEYGSDYLGQFLVLLSFIFATIAIKKKKLTVSENKELFYISFLLIIFSITTKFLYIIYIIVPITVFFYILTFEQVFKFALNKKFLSISFFAILSIIFYNLTATGCILYPVVFTCFTETIDWSISEATVKYLNIHYKAWSKAGIGTGYGTLNPQEYISGINWIENWFRKYFFTKVSDYILVVIFVLLIFLIVFKKNFKVYNKIDFNLKIVLLSYLSILAVFLIWFLNFPTLRYAGYTIVFLVLAVPVALFIAKRLNFNNKIIYKKIKILIILAIFVFNFKNINRIHKELSLKNYENHNFSNFPFYWVDKVEFRTILLEEKFFSEVTNKKHCWNVPPTCLKNKSQLKIEYRNNYYFYKNK